MVHLALPAVAVLALTPMIGAVAVPATNEPQTEMFSWYKWIDAKIKNPEGDHLTPDQAVAAWEASLNATVAHRSLDMRAVDPCFVVQGQKRAFVPDAVWCINNLAAKGNTACVVRGPVTRFCTHNRGAITGVAGSSHDESATCNNVARAGGRIMDLCTAYGNSQDSNSVYGQEPAFGNPHLQVHVHGP